MEIRPLFTEEAERLLAEESQRLAAELRDEAINEALRLRGEPIEVTASDVRRARAVFERAPPSLLRPTTRKLLRLYAVVGWIMFLLGVSLPTIKQVVRSSDPESQLWYLMALSGLVVGIVGWVGELLGTKGWPGDWIRRGGPPVDRSRDDGRRSR